MCSGAERRFELMMIRSPDRRSKGRRGHGCLAGKKVAVGGLERDPDSMRERGQTAAMKSREPQRDCDER